MVELVPRTCFTSFIKVCFYYSNTESEVTVFNSLYFTPNVKFVIRKSAKLYPTTFRSMLGNASARDFGSNIRATLELKR